MRTQHAGRRLLAERRRQLRHCRARPRAARPARRAAGRWRYRELFRRDAQHRRQLSSHSSTTRSSSFPKEAAPRASSSRWWRSEWRCEIEARSAAVALRSCPCRLVRCARVGERADLRRAGHPAPRQPGAQRRCHLVGRVRPRIGLRLKRRATRGPELVRSCCFRQIPGPRLRSGCRDGSACIWPRSVSIEGGVLCSRPDLSARLDGGRRVGAGSDGDRNADAACCRRFGAVPSDRRVVWRWPGSARSCSGGGGYLRDAARKE